MSREKNLQKAIVLSLLLTNVWCGAAYAADGTDGTNGADISDAKVIPGVGITESFAGNDGTIGTDGNGGNGGNGGAMAYKEVGSRELQIGELTGTWYEIGLGANLGIAKNSNLYFDALKTFGGDLRTDWQFNAGLRFSF